MNTEHTNQSRTQFEAWASEHCCAAGGISFKRFSDDGASSIYNDPNVETAWQAWQAASQQQAEPVAPAVKESLTAQPEPVALSLPFFVYDSETGFERFATEAEAKAAAQESIDAYREEAGEGWAETVENICWGVVLGTTREVALPDEYSGGNGLADDMKPVDYVLTDAAQPPAVAGAVPDAEILAHFYGGKDQDAMNYSNLRDVVYQFTQSELLCAARAMLAAAPQAATLSAALADIAAERRRQIEQERWTPDRDDRLLNGQLATAAGYYALAAGWPHERDIGRGLKPQYWPFNQEWWKPTTARHNLVKAGALIAAEIERIDRAAQKGGA